MAGGKKGPNAKAVAGNALKAANEEKKKAAAAAEAERRAAESWNDGANTRKQSRDAEAAAKADEAARKRREKAELLAAEEAALPTGGKAKTPSGPKKKGGKKKDDLGLLEDALVSAADKKVKKQKALEREKKEKQALEAAAKPKEEVPMDPLMANTEKMMINDELVGRDANKARMEEEGTSGIDAALSVLNVGGDGVTLKSAKALYNAFEEKMMPVVKEEHPGLRLTQYKEKIWQLWKKSPENPANQKAQDA